MKRFIIMLTLVSSSLIVNVQAGAYGKAGLTDPGNFMSEPKNVEVPVSGLPKIIIDNIAKTHPGFTIKKALWDWSTLRVPGYSFVYEIIVTNRSNEETLFFSKEGKFIRKLN